ncbi:MAG: phenylacetate--CoA ligase family protein [Gammaproteobacteria bacterium]|nr:phenylacetate--CoA ligase family protein [Gammaproteobacteria bacterium]
MLTWLSKHVVFPLWEVKEGAGRGQYLRELSDSQWWPEQKIRQHQWERLRAIIEYAFDNCPYYRERFGDVGVPDSLKNWSDFRRLPILTKRDIRYRGDALLSREFRVEDLVEAKTGGSTGTALKVYADKKCREQRNAAALRSDRWAGWDIGMKVAAIWGNPPVADTLKKKLRNLLLDRMFYLDTMNISEESVRNFVKEWRREKPKVLYGHAHSIYILATYLLRIGVTDLRPDGIITTSMMLLAAERRLIEKVLSCRVTNRYGSEEVSLIACECERNEGFHLNADHVVVEFLKDDGTEAAPGEEANIIVTDLINHAMPLIRYQVGDMGVPSIRTCSCGRGLPLMERVTGRRADFLKRPDRSLVAGVSLIERTLTAIPGIEQMQLVQDDLYRVCVNVVRDSHYSKAGEKQLLQEFQSVFGEGVKIEIRHVSGLDQTSSGKYRFAICNV